MIFVEKGERVSGDEDLPSRLIVITLLELLSYLLFFFVAGGFFGPSVVDIILLVK